MQKEKIVHITGYDINSIFKSISSTQVDSVTNEGHIGRINIAVIERIHMNLAHRSFNSIAEVAALYAEVIARSHVFYNGSQTALACMLTFLGLNGIHLRENVDQNELSNQIDFLISGNLNSKDFSAWLEHQFV